MRRPVIRCQCERDAPANWSLLGSTRSSWIPLASLRIFGERLRSTIDGVYDRRRHSPVRIGPIGQLRRAELRA